MLNLLFKNLPSTLAGAILSLLFYYWLFWASGLLHGQTISITVGPTEEQQCSQSTSTSLH